MILCDSCQTAITDQAGVVLWMANGLQPRTVLTVHKRCQDSPLIKMFLPHGRREQPLAQFLETVLEVIST